MNTEPNNKLINELSDSVADAVVDAMREWFDSLPDESAANKFLAQLDTLSALRLTMCEQLGISVETLEKIMAKELSTYKHRLAQKSR